MATARELKIEKELNATQANIARLEKELAHAKTVRSQLLKLKLAKRAESPKYAENGPSPVGNRIAKRLNTRDTN